MRPVAKQYKIGLGWNVPYPPELAHITEDGKHHGVDFLTPKGIPVIASANGIVNFTGWKRGYGWCVYIKFWQGWRFSRRTFRVILAHLSIINLNLIVGRKILKWDKIGESGNSGMATGPHLHAEVQELKDNRWIPVNPDFLFGEA